MTALRDSPRRKAGWSGAFDMDNSQSGKFVHVSVEALSKQMAKVWTTHFDSFWPIGLTDPLDILREAEEVRRIVLPNLLEVHPLLEIARFALKDTVEHAEAFKVLDGKDTAIVHARAVEEIGAVLEYILKAPSRYREFNWRWESSGIVSAIRGRMSRGEPLHPKMLTWIDANAQQLKDYFKIRGAPPLDEERWRDAANWLYRVSLKTVFGETGRANSFSYAAYAWANHATHFSPLGDRFSEMQPDGSYFNMWRQFMDGNIHALVRALAPMSNSPELFRKVRAATALRVLYRYFAEQGANAVQAANKSAKMGLVIGVLMEEPSDLARVVAALTGKESPDPLVLKLTGQ